MGAREWSICDRLTKCCRFMTCRPLYESTRCVGDLCSTYDMPYHVMNLLAFFTKMRLIDRCWCTRSRVQQWDLSWFEDDIDDIDVVSQMTGVSPQRRQVIYCGCPIKGMPTNMTDFKDLNSGLERNQPLKTPTVVFEPQSRGALLTSVVES